MTPPRTTEREPVRCVRTLIDARRRERLWSLPMAALFRAAAPLFACFLAACATQPKEVPPAPPEPAPPPVAVKQPQVDESARVEQAKAMLAQAETDVQRARSRRALWQRAWEELIAARKAVAGNDSQAAIDHSKRASEFAQLGLEQLAYPAVK